MLSSKKKSLLNYSSVRLSLTGCGLRPSEYQNGKGEPRMSNAPGQSSHAWSTLVAVVQRCVLKASLLPQRLPLPVPLPSGFPEIHKTSSCLRTTVYLRSMTSFHWSMLNGKFNSVFLFQSLTPGLDCTCENQSVKP